MNGRKIEQLIRTSNVGGIAPYYFGCYCIDDLPSTLKDNTFILLNTAKTTDEVGGNLRERERERERERDDDSFD